MTPTNGTFLLPDILQSFEDVLLYYIVTCTKMSYAILLVVVSSVIGSWKMVTI